MKQFLDPGDLRKFASDLPIVIATFIEKSPQFIAGLARVEVSVVESAAYQMFVRGLDLEGDEREVADGLWSSERLRSDSPISCPPSWTICLRLLFPRVATSPSGMRSL
jgi:hypothetical protein